MKKLLLYVFVSIVMAHSLSAQIINIYSNGTGNRFKVKAVTEDAIVTDHGVIKDSEVDSIQLVKGGTYADLILRTYHVFPLDPFDESLSSDADDEGTDIDMYIEARTQAKTIQLIGALVLTTVTILDLKYASDNEKGFLNDPDYKPKKVPGGLRVLGFGCLGIGLGFDIDAKRYLKRR